MIKKVLFFFFLLFVSFIANSQEIEVNSSDSYVRFVKLLENSKDIKYQEILNRYDVYIKKHPKNVKVKVYRCKFIGTSYYDDYDDYNLKYEETESCLNALYEEYPEDPEVILYKLENTYGEEKEKLLEAVLSNYGLTSETWNYKRKSELFESAMYHYTEVNDVKAIIYGEKAERFGDTLDLSLAISNAKLRLGNIEGAKETMLDGLSYEHEAWILKSKADLLVKIGEHDEALKMFNRVNEKDSTLTSNTSLYEIFNNQENYTIAREYLVKDTIIEWNRIEKIQKLFKHDLKHSDPDTAMLSYRRLQESDFYDDFLGIKRFRLFLKSPFQPVSFDDFLHFLVLILCIVAIFLVPYLWVLPIYGAEKFFFKKEKPIETAIKPYWNLTHFWIISFVYLMIQFFVVLAFYYEDYINYYFDIVSSYADETPVETDADLASILLVYMILLFVSTLLFLNKTRLNYVLRTNKGFLRMIGMGIGFVIFNAIFLKILGSVVDLSDMSTLITELSARAEIKALLSEYGLLTSILIVALIGPFYEEVIFRGIILSATRHRIGFVWANIIQSFLFGLVHFNLKLFIFYFVFGLVTGYMVKKSNGLLTGFFFHAINNLFVVLTLYMVMKLTGFG